MKIYYMKYFTLNYKIHEINFITYHLMAVQSVIMSMSILRFLKPIDGIPVPNGQLLSLVSAVIRGMNQEVCIRLSSHQAQLNEIH